MAKKKAMSWINSVPSMDKKELGINELQKLQKILDDRELYINVYSGADVSGHLKILFDEAAIKTAPFPKQNIVDRAIRRMALVFKDQPEYDYGEKAKLPDQYDEQRRWRFMKETERVGDLLGTVVARPVIRLDGQEKPYMDYERLWFYIPFFGENPYEPIAIMYPISSGGTDLMGAGNKRWRFWSATETYITDNKGAVLKDPNNPENENPYGVMPFESFHIRAQVNDYWTTGYGQALVDANDAINVGLMEMRLGVRLNLLGQWYVTGMQDPAKEFKMGVGKVPQLPMGVELNVKNPQADMDSAILNMKFEVENTLQNIGLYVVWGEEGGVPSGESLKVKNIELIERREDDVPNWQGYDDRIYEKERIIWEKTDGLMGKLPETRAANYQEMEFPLHPQEQRDRDDWSLEKGIISLVDFYLRENPDIFSEIEDQEERRQAIIDHIKQNQAENSQLKIRQGEAITEAPRIFERRLRSGENA